MAHAAQEEQLLDIRVAEASAAYKFYLNQERKILGTIAVVGFLLTWETIGNWAGLINPMFMSAPSLIGKAAWQMFASGEIWNDLYVSGIEFFWGYFLSIIFAIPFGIAIGWYKKFALLINTRDGVKTTPANLLTAARSFGASEWQIFKSVVLPSTVPFILTGLRLAVGRALIGVMVGELYAATAGIGFMITVAGATFQTDKVFVGVLIFAITGMIMTDVIDRYEQRFDKWRPKVGAE